MADAPHRLAAQVSMAQAEQARQDAFSPAGDSDPGQVLADADDFGPLGMSDDVEVPDVGPLVPPPLREGRPYDPGIGRGEQ